MNKLYNSFYLIHRVIKLIGDIRHVEIVRVLIHLSEIITRLMKLLGNKTPISRELLLENSSKILAIRFRLGDNLMNRLALPGMGVEVHPGHSGEIKSKDEFEGSIEDNSMGVHAEEIRAGDKEADSEDHREDHGLNVFSFEDFSEFHGLPFS